MLILIIGLIILAGIAMAVGVLHNRQIQKKIESGELKELIKGQSNKLFEYDEKSAKQINDLKELIKEQIIEMSSKEEANAREEIIVKYQGKRQNM